MLLEKGADCDIADKDEHFTVLMYAAAVGEERIVEALLQHKVDVIKKIGCVRLTSTCKFRASFD